MSFDILIQMELTFKTIKFLIYQSIIPSKAQQRGGQVNNNAFFVAFCWPCLPIQGYCV
jgi:hypothetical protein